MELKERIRALKFSIKDNIANIKYPCMADIKYDGMPVIVTYLPGKPLLLTTEAGIEWNLNHLPITMAGFQSGEFIAEWIHGTGKNNAIWKLLSAIHKNLTSTSLRVFDILELNGVSLNRETLSTRRSVLKSIIKPEFLPRSWIVNNSADLLIVSRDMHEEGYEGLVVKNLNEQLALQRWVKLKPPQFLTLSISKVDASRIEVIYEGVEVGINLPGFPVNIGDIVKIKHYGVTTNGSLRNAVCIEKL